MSDKDKYQEFWDLGCMMAQLDGHPFVIVEYDLSKRPDFEDFLDSVLNEVEHRDSPYWREDFYGYSESYDACTDCQAAICTQPSSGMADPYWIISGDILCKKCTREHDDEYMDWYGEEIRRGKAHNFLLDLDENHFTLVLPNCANGLHDGDADSPYELARWATANDFQVAFEVWSDQFTMSFNVYMRRWDEENWGSRKLTEEEVAKVRESLCDNVNINQYHSYCSLRQEFREWPAPADRAKAILRGYTGGA